jgi:hypothetical protein
MRKSSHRAFATRLLLSTALPFAVLATGSMPAFAATVYDPVVPGSYDGAPGFTDGSGNGTAGGAGTGAFADAGFFSTNSDSINQAFATGGNGGAGGDAGGILNNAGAGGDAGGASAYAGTGDPFTFTGYAQADATAVGGNGGASAGFGATGANGGTAARATAARTPAPARAN